MGDGSMTAREVTSDQFAQIEQLLREATTWAQAAKSNSLTLRQKLDYQDRATSRRRI